MFLADGPPQLIETTLAQPYYDGWLFLNIVGAMSTLFGKRLTTKASRAQPGESNASIPAAWMQFTGDLMVWGAICVYILCVINTSAWGQGLYGAFFVLMGVPGGLMFTLRSVRRIQQINRRERGFYDNDSR